VLCIVEAMKLMNEIESDVAGEVVKKLIANGQPIEYGQDCLHSGEEVRVCRDARRADRALFCVWYIVAVGTDWSGNVCSMCRAGDSSRVWFGQDVAHCFGVWVRMILFWL